MGSALLFLEKFLSREKQFLLSFLVFENAPRGQKLSGPGLPPFFPDSVIGVFEILNSILQIPDLTGD